MTDQAVVIQRRLPAPIERVFEAWTQVEFLKQWFAPMNSVVEEALADTRPGGAYRFAMVAGEDRFVVFGEYKRIERPTLVEFTWQWEESSNEKGVSLVTVELTPDGFATELKLIHTKLSSPTSQELHTQGWTSVLNRLSTYLKP